MDNTVNGIEFETQNDNGDIDCSGTSYTGKITTRFSQLVKTFGLPLEASEDGKSKAGREILFSDGVVATIYDYKQYDKELDDITERHVGGRGDIASLDVVDRIIKILFG